MGTDTSLFTKTHYMIFTTMLSYYNKELKFIVRLLSWDTPLATMDVILHGLEWETNINAFKGVSPVIDTHNGIMYLIKYDICSSAQVVTAQDVPLFINWTWLSEVFKQDMFIR
jgi:hypothetical protein